MEGFPEEKKHEKENVINQDKETNINQKELSQPRKKLRRKKGGCGCGNRRK